MAASKLNLNPSKTEFILFGSVEQCKLLSAFFPIDKLGNKPYPVDNLGVMFDACFSCQSHMNQICKQCSYNTVNF